jgi:hypothetical protein
MQFFKIFIITSINSFELLVLQKQIHKKMIFELIVFSDVFLLYCFMIIGITFVLFLKKNSKNFEDVILWFDVV